MLVAWSRRAFVGEGANYSVFACRRLFGALPDQVSSSAGGGLSRDVEFITGDAERFFSLDPVEIRERTALNLLGNSLICLAHRVSPEVGKASLHHSFVFFWSSLHAIIGYKFGKIRTGEDGRKAAVRTERLLAHRIGTVIIGRLAVLLKRDGNKRPGPHKLVSRLRDRLLSGQKNSENQR
jgi:hypothetical protein